MGSEQTDDLLVQVGIDDQSAQVVHVLPKPRLLETGATRNRNEIVVNTWHQSNPSW